MTYHLFTRMLLASLVAGLLALVYWVASQTLWTDTEPPDNSPEWSSISLAQPSASEAEADARRTLKDETSLQSQEDASAQAALESASAPVGAPASDAQPAAAPSSLPVAASAPVASVVAATPSTPAAPTPAAPARQPSVPAAR